MLRVKVSSSGKRAEANVDKSAMLSEAFAQADIDFNGLINLNGTIIDRTSLNKTFESFGYTDGTIFLASVPKCDNAK